MRAPVTRLLYILPGLVPPSADPTRDKFTYLSQICEGEILLPIWWSSINEIDIHLRESFPVYRVGRFSYHLFLFTKLPAIMRKIGTFFWYLKRGLQLHRENNIGVIVTYGTNTPAIAGAILKWLTGAKLIIEIPGVPENAFRYDVPNPGRGAVLKRFFADRVLSTFGRAADCFKLLYPSQLQKYPNLRSNTAAIFHDFVPIRCMKLAEKEGNFLLSVGHPWYTKGFDIVIRSFKLIAKQFPDYKLKIVGYVPDRQHLEDLAQDYPQIEILGFRLHEIAMKEIATCTIYVLASRTEAMGRVLLEAMAGARPIIASNVGGVSHYVSDNDNGLLFTSESVEELAEKMIHLLRDNQLRARLGHKGYERVFSEFDEMAYIRAFSQMLRLVQDNTYK
jgi:glycosyltransferase involved in cell wall biosynthesis